jgi:Ca-activated chloride channel homolog
MGENPVPMKTTTSTSSTPSFPGRVLVITFLLILVCSVMAFRCPGGYTLVPTGGHDGTGAIRGIVKEAGTARALDSVLIKVVKGSTIVLQTASTGTGRFEIPAITPGPYYLQAESPGHASWDKRITVAEGQATVVTILLKPLLKVPATVESLVITGIQAPVSSKSMASSVAFECRQPAAYGGTPQEFNTESYDRIDENGFREALNDPVSTFSIDVDKASYSNVRRFLSSNTMPYKDAVRIEEMINYFDYDYPQPTGAAPFSVTFETGTCPWNEAHRLALIGIKGKDVQSGQVPPGNFVFLIDVSGSMESANKLPLIKQAFRILVGHLRAADRVAIVVYAGAAGCVLESTPGEHRETILSAIDGLEAGGCTAGGAGLTLAYRIAKENYIPGGNNRVILATDGDFNIGASSDAEMTRLIEEKRKGGVFLSVLGFGMGNYKDSKMEKIADAGDGNYAYIDNILEAKKVFGEELWGTLYTIARDVKIQVEFNPAQVKAYRLIGYENRILNREDFNDDRKDAGDIGAGHSVTALYELIPAGSEEQMSSTDPLVYQSVRVIGGPELMTVKLRYKIPSDTISKLIVSKVKDHPAGGSELCMNLMFSSAVAEFGMLLRDSEFKGTASYDKVIALAAESKGKDPYGYRQEFIRMVQIASLLAR